MKRILKFCGLTRKKDIVELLNYVEINALGFISYKKSPRYISPKNLKPLLEPIKDIPQLLKVGVFVNSSIKEILSYIEIGINTIQLHGDESIDFIQELKKQAPKIEIWKVFRLKNIQDINKIKDYSVKTILIDSFTPNEYGGTGKTTDWSLVKIVKKNFPEKNIILAGGINSENIKEIAQLFPNIYGIDLSSSIEDTPGKKSVQKTHEFFKKYLMYFT